MTEFNINVMVERVTEKIYENDPTLVERYGDKGRTKCVEDNHHHFKHLETAYELDNSAFFIDYAIWLDGILQKFGMSTQLLMDNFDFIIEVLLEEQGKQRIENTRIGIYTDYLKQANDVLRSKVESH
ncbi:hypothetical protein [Fictibacillus norfolkensis]|uniref:Uncharacterized protein n=1 Tax=Fictibacillus norfolkensis TaxID=2762233 RepID=A0ABR8SR66_9BACL|nr:hypothetical protein [Fictibacillus norfolkensis]MBD7965995.1 hypothetical protein [Fictibacillus norfolkensis]